MFQKANSIIKNAVITIAAVLLSPKAFSQTEVKPWGNITSIRLMGQPMIFTSSIRIVGSEWKSIKATEQEKQRPKYMRNGPEQIINTEIDSIRFTETITELGLGAAKVTIQTGATADRRIEGIFLAITLPQEYYGNGSIQINNEKTISLTNESIAAKNYSSVNVVRLVSVQRQLVVSCTEPTSVILRRENTKGLYETVVYFGLQSGSVSKGQTFFKNFTIKASGKVDNRPITLRLNAAKSGRAFEGLGGNFRLQNPRTDPEVIDYCLNRLRVAFGRVEMPWRFWQPQENSSPIDSAKTGKLNSNVQDAMKMAQRLNKMGIPVILTAWSAPEWAIVGTPKFNPGSDGVWGNPIDHTKEAQIYKSIADYISYLKELYGVEVRFFSFNEPDLGINIRQTGAEHAAFIKGLGAYLVSRKLNTKILLGDNSDATTYEFIYPAINDTATYPYIGAISFHSWRGWETEILQKWAEAATKLDRPLLVGEGSIDAAAWSYPGIFEEPIYALEEINLYTRLLAICQPASILQWQLTADYSPLAGGGIFGNNEPLHPTQRFWNLKQLSSTQKGLKFMPVHVDRPLISAAVMGDNQKRIYALHIVNNGAARTLKLLGLPPKMKVLRIYITDSKRAMQREKDINVKHGQANFHLASAAYTTLTNQ